MIFHKYLNIHRKIVERNSTFKFFKDITHNTDLLLPMSMAVETVLIKLMYRRPFVDALIAIETNTTTQNIGINTITY